MNAKPKNPYITMLLSVVIAFLTSLALVAASALLMQKQVLGLESVKVVNPIIKSVSALLAGLIGSRRFEKAGWLFGALSGVFYIALATLGFSLLSGGIELGVSNIVDVLMCAFAGMIGGIIRSLAR